MNANMAENTVICPVYKEIMRRTSFIVLILLLLSALPTYALAQEKAVEGFRSTDLPLPRFVSLRSNKVYARTGPALRYPIKWVYQREEMPVEIVQEYGNWRKIKDVNGDDGWIHQSLITGERTILIQAQDLVPMHEGFSLESRLVARLEPEVVASIDKCIDSWCRIETGGYHGWVERNYLWGIYVDEIIN